VPLKWVKYSLHATELTLISSDFQWLTLEGGLRYLKSLETCYGLLESV